MQRERWEGTLELLVTAPARFPLVMLPTTIAMSSLGLYSMAATLLWGRLVFGIGVHIVHPLVFCAAILVTVLSIGVTGFLMAVSFVRYRTAWALGNLFEYPVWLICGFLVPLCCSPAGCTRSPGCSRPPGASTPSASPRSAGLRSPTSGSAPRLASAASQSASQFRSGCSGRRVPGQRWR